MKKQFSKNNCKNNYIFTEKLVNKIYFCKLKSYRT